MIDRYKINKIVECLSTFVFEFETDEVIEKLNSILSHYDLVDIKLTEEEYYFIIDELLPIAEQFEFREVEYLTFHKTTNELQYI